MMLNKLSGSFALATSKEPLKGKFTENLKRFFLSNKI